MNSPDKLRTGNKDVGRKLSYIKERLGISNENQILRICIHRMYVYLQKQEEKGEYL